MEINKMKTISFLVPDIGTCFTYLEKKYYLFGWIKQSPDPKQNESATVYDQFMIQDTIQPYNKKLEFCLRDEAEYVYGMGEEESYIAHLTDITVNGRTKNPERTIERQRTVAVRIIGQKLTCDLPGKKN